MAKPPRKRVLSDHKKTGKKLVPPITSLTGDRLQLTSWPRTGIPELVWLALLHDEDEELGVRAADTLAAAARKTDHKTPFCFASHFATLPEADVAAIWKNVPAADQAFLQFALQPLIAGYPTCPLKRVLPATTGPAHLPRLKRVLSSMFDKTSRSSTIALATMLYIIVHAGRFFLHPESRLLQLERIHDYPETEESRAMASELRSVTIMWFMPPQYEENCWPNEFWNRGLELEPCTYE